MELRRPGRAAAVGMLAAVLLVAVAILVPVFWDRDVRVHWPPLHAVWGPRLDVRILPAIAIGVTLALVLPGLLRRLAFPAAVATAAGASWVWTTSLALSDGPYGLSRVFERSSEYLVPAAKVDDIGVMLSTFVSRIPSGVEDNWPTHVAGHPPGAFLIFIGFDRIGLTNPFWIAVVVLTLGASAVAAVMLTIDELGSRDLARRAGTWLALAPLVVWAGVSADWMFAAVGAWGLYLLARSGRRHSVVAGLGAGVLLGFCVFLSYGLVLLGVLALAVVWVSGSWKPLVWAVLSALGVTAAFALAGFEWWEAFPVLQQRYYEGIASDRPYGYFVWANLAAWTFTVGLATWAAFPFLWHRLRASWRDPLPVLVVAGLLTIAVATLSGMSKAEVERIWLPFTVWVVAVGALLPARWVRPALLAQVGLAVLVQVLLVTRW